MNPVEIDHFVLVAPETNDLRFGLIDVYAKIDDESELIFVKKQSFDIQDDFEVERQNAERRLIQNHPNIIHMLDYKIDSPRKLIWKKFEYPNNDLAERFMFLKSADEMIKFTIEILSGLAHLQENSKEFGNLRPEFIYFSDISKLYVIVERMGPHASVYQSFKSFWDQKEENYCPPEIFNKLCENSQNLPTMTFKTDVFNLGMILATLLSTGVQVQSVYDFKEGEFNRFNFEVMITEIDAKLSVPSVLRLIWVFVKESLLEIDPEKRLDAKKAYEKFQKINFQNDLLNMTSKNDLPFELFEPKVLKDDDESFLIEDEQQTIEIQESKDIDMLMFKKKVDQSEQTFEQESEQSLKKLPTKVTENKGFKFTFGNSEYEKALIEAAVKKNASFVNAETNVKSDFQQILKEEKKKQEKRVFSVIVLKEPIMKQLKSKEKQIEVCQLCSNMLNNSSIKVKMDENLILKVKQENEKKYKNDVKIESGTFDLSNHVFAKRSGSLDQYNEPVLMRHQVLLSPTNNINKIAINEENHETNQFLNTTRAKLSDIVQEYVINPDKTYGNNIENLSNNYRNSGFKKNSFQLSHQQPNEVIGNEHELKPSMRTSNNFDSILINRANKEPLTQFITQSPQNLNREEDKLYYLIPSKHVSNSNLVNGLGLRRSLTPVVINESTFFVEEKKEKPQTQGIMTYSNSMKRNSSQLTRATGEENKNVSILDSKYYVVNQSFMNPVEYNGQPKSQPIQRLSNFLKGNFIDQSKNNGLPIKIMSTENKYQNGQSKSAIWVNAPRGNYFKVESFHLT